VPESEKKKTEKPKETKKALPPKPKEQPKPPCKPVEKVLTRSPTKKAGTYNPFDRLSLRKRKP
jgi:hypothetical protein